MFEWEFNQQIIVVVCIVLVAVFWGAVRFVDRGIEHERRQFEAGQDYDARHVRLSTVHARQDIMLLCHLTYWVVGLLVVLTALVAAHVFHHW